MYTFRERRRPGVPDGDVEPRLPALQGQRPAAAQM